METKQTKGLKRNTIDKYYTKDIVVELCLNLVKKYFKYYLLNKLSSSIVIRPYYSSYLMFLKFFKYF